jgi:hypothetical protein
MKIMTKIYNVALTCFFFWRLAARVNTSLASFILDSAPFMFFCDIYYISLGMLAFSTSFFSSVMRINTQHINVHRNARRLLMDIKDTH